MPATMMISSFSSSSSNLGLNLPEDKTQQQQQQQLLSVFTLIVIISIFGAMYIAHYIWFQRTLSKRLGGVPVMHRTKQGRSIPYLGHAINFLRYRPWDLLTDWHLTYGPLFCFPLLFKMQFSAASPNLLKQILQSKIALVKKDVKNTMKPFLVILGTGIVTSEDQSWMKQRLKMSHPLRSDVLEIIPTQTIIAVQHLMRKMDQAAKTGQAIPLGESLRHLTLQVISGSFLSLSAEESDTTFAKMYLPIVDESNMRVWHPYRAFMIFMPFWWRNRRNVRRLNVYVSGLIRQRWLVRRKEAAAAAATAAAAGLNANTRSTDTNNKRPIDILDRVMASYEKDCGNDDNNIPPILPEEHVRQLRDEMKTFMLAGHETSAAMMTWALYEFMGTSAQDTLVKPLLQEAMQVFDPKVDWSTVDAASITTNTSTTALHVLSPDKLAQLQFSEACLRESLRKYSVVPIVARRTIQDLYLTENDGHTYMVPKGSSIMINIQAVHLNPDIWPNPYNFDPTRFMPEHVDKIQPYTFLPFIAGPRNCLGQHLALLESKMVISMLVQRYQFRLPPGQSVHTQPDWSRPDLDPRHRFMIPVIPKEELMVHVSMRE